MAEYDSELVATIADSVRPYVRTGHAEEVAVEVLTDLVADGWEIRHPNDDDVDQYAVGSISLAPDESEAGQSRSAGGSSAGG